MTSNLVFGSCWIATLTLWWIGDGISKLLLLIGCISSYSGMVLTIALQYRCSLCRFHNRSNPFEFVTRFLFSSLQQDALGSSPKLKLSLQFVSINPASALLDFHTLCSFLLLRCQNVFRLSVVANNSSELVRAAPPLFQIFILFIRQYDRNTSYKIIWSILHLNSFWKC